MIPAVGIQEPIRQQTPCLKWHTFTRPSLVHFARPLTLVQQVSYDHEGGTVSVTFHPNGIKTLADELANRESEDAA